jgi:hypothetical protein
MVFYVVKDAMYELMVVNKKYGWSKSSEVRSDVARALVLFLGFLGDKRC